MITPGFPTIFYQAIEDPGQEKKFVFKPKYNIRDKKALLKLLDRYILLLLMSITGIPQQLIGSRS